MKGQQLLFFSAVVCFAFACNSVRSTISTRLFYGVWKVDAFKFHEGERTRIMPGEYMGYPQYEFTKEGTRIKTLNEEPAPPPEKVVYELRNDSIIYPKNSKLPAVKILRLTKDSLILRSEKLDWHLYRGE
jgi:hypothetical protein